MLIVVKTPIRKILYVKAPKWLEPYIEKYA
jgi:hypothetical protein